MSPLRRHALVRGIVDDLVPAEALIPGVKASGEPLELVGRVVSIHRPAKRGPPLYVVHLQVPAEARQYLADHEQVLEVAIRAFHEDELTVVEEADLPLTLWQVDGYHAGAIVRARTAEEARRSAVTELGAAYYSRSTSATPLVIPDHVAVVYSWSH